MKTGLEPIIVKRGGIVVRIYPRKKGESVYFQVADYSSGKRKFVGFVDLREAKLHAELIATKLVTSARDVLQLTKRERESYLRAVQRLAPLGLSLDAAIEEFVEARRILGKGSLVRAAQIYIERDSGKP